MIFGYFWTFKKLMPVKHSTTASCPTFWQTLQWTTGNLPRDEHPVLIQEAHAEVILPSAEQVIDKVVLASRKSAKNENNNNNNNNDNNNNNNNETLSNLNMISSPRKNKTGTNDQLLPTHDCHARHSKGTKAHSNFKQ